MVTADKAWRFIAHRYRSVDAPTFVRLLTYGQYMLMAPMYTTYTQSLGYTTS